MLLHAKWHTPHLYLTFAYSGKSFAARGQRHFLVFLFLMFILQQVVICGWGQWSPLPGCETQQVSQHLLMAEKWCPPEVCNGTKSFLMSSSMAWTVGSIAHSASLEMTPSWGCRDTPEGQDAVQRDLDKLKWPISGGSAQEGHGWSQCRGRTSRWSEAAQRGGGCPSSGNIQGQAGQGSEQPDLLKFSLIIAGGLGYVAFKGHFQPKGFYDSMKKASRI